MIFFKVILDEVTKKNLSGFRQTKRVPKLMQVFLQQE
jgi:hypothetical protein